MFLRRCWVPGGGLRSFKGLLYQGRRYSDVCVILIHYFGNLENISKPSFLAVSAVSSLPYINLHSLQNHQC